MRFEVMPVMVSGLVVVDSTHDGHHLHHSYHYDEHHHEGDDSRLMKMTGAKSAAVSQIGWSASSVQRMRARRVWRA